jgi:glycosyltransferase involved in cell wall biosynthesis
MIQHQAATAPAYSSTRKLRLAYFVTHPIQYQAPMLRRISQERDIDLTVFFSSDISTRGYLDRGFGVSVKWDVPLLDGYKHEFLPVLYDTGRIRAWSPINYGIKSALRRRGFEAVWVHGYSSLTTFRAILAASSLKLPVIVRSEASLTDRPRSHSKLLFKRLFFNAMRNRISAAMSIGEANRSYWRHYMGDQFPVFPFYYAVDNAFFQRECAKAAEKREAFRQSLGLEPGRPVILYASKLQTRKRCGDLLQAYLKWTRDAEAVRRPYLLIVGDGEERAALEAQAREAHPGDVRFLGFRNQTELPQFYDLCNVFVLVSIHEPWGLVINEVMNAGRAVIVSDQVGCHRDLVKDGANGFVVKAGDIDGLMRGLGAVLSDEATWQAMGQSSLDQINEFSFEQNVCGLRQALAHVVPGFAAVSA